MSDTTKIEWCDATFNPWWGCTRISPACDYCYAAALAKRYGHDVWDNGARRTFGEAHWAQPMTWARSARNGMLPDGKTPTGGRRPRIFCASMADVFDKDAPEGAREWLWMVIKTTPELDWLLLTKRIGNARSMLPADWGDGYPNVWLGSTIANQEEANRDVPKLCATPARVRFLSYEPALGAIDLRNLTVPRRYGTGLLDAFTLDFKTHYQDVIAGPRSGHGPIDWVIAGGESGGKARPPHPVWFRDLRDQCEAAGVPFLFKQWGEWHPGSERRGRHACVDLKGRVAEPCTRDNFPPGAESSDGWTILARVGKKAAGRELDGRTHDGFPHA